MVVRYRYEDPVDVAEKDVLCEATSVSIQNKYIAKDKATGEFLYQYDCRCAVVKTVEGDEIFVPGIVKWKETYEKFEEKKVLDLSALLGFKNVSKIDVCHIQSYLKSDKFYLTVGIL